MENTPLDPAEQSRIRGIFEKVPFARLLGIKMESLTEGGCTLSLGMRADLRQRYGVMHGGVIATLVDTAAAYAVFPRVPAGKEITTVEFKVSFLSSIRDGGRAFAEARLLRLGRRIGVCACEVQDENGNPAASALVTYMVIDRPSRPAAEPEP